MAATTTWGRWTFNPGNLCLETHLTVPGGQQYQIPVDEMTSSAAVLDWIFHQEEKTYLTSEDLGDLVRAIAALVGRGICANQQDHPVPKADMVAKLQKRYGGGTT